ncbi:unnamed protein product [Cunninghamella blakesleeana]
MLRINNIRVQQQLKPLYRQGLFAIRYESTTSSTTSSTVKEEPKNNNKNDKATEKRIPLSQRLGGSGRGKILDSNDGKGNNDAFATFLLQEQKKQKARKENKQRRNNKERSEAKPGQFDDAVEDNVVNKNQRKAQQANSNNSNVSNNNNNNSNNKRQQRSRDRKGQRQNNKKSVSGGSTSVPIRRATTFIDKDIDWTSLSSVDISKQSVEGEQKEGKDQELQLQQLESENGDYSRFISVGQSIQWSDSINKQALESLVIRNPSYNLDQKLVFLETVAKVSNVGTTVKK